MSKRNSLIKYLKNINTYINSLLEKNLNKLKLENIRNLITNNKIILTFVALFIFFISYLLIPTFYKHSDIITELKSDLSKKLNLEFEFPQNISYNFFPRPHFIISDSIISYKKTEFSKVKNLKLYVSLDNFFSLKNIEIKDVHIENANFNFNKKNYNFFLDLLNNNFENKTLVIKNSNIFFRNSFNEVLFINKILQMKYFYDSNELKNGINSKNEIFNVPYELKIYDDKIQNKLISKINLNFLRLQIENELVYEDQIKLGKANLILNKSKSEIRYEAGSKSFKFTYYDQIDNPKFSYVGNFNFYPFYSSIKGKTNYLNILNLINQNGIIAQVLKTEILNNKNIDFVSNIKANNFYNNLNFENISFNSKIKEGLIDIDDTSFKWKGIADFKILESLLYVQNGELLLDGKVKIDISNYDEIYRYLLTPKNNRKKFKVIELSFSYNFDKKITNLDDIKIDNLYNQELNNIMSNIILKDNNLQNKIYLKNLLNQAIKSYSG